MNAAKPARYICRSCRLQQARRRRISSSTRTALDSGFARLQSRRLLAIHGQDAAHFLQGLTTQNIPTSGLLSSPSSPQVLYSALMNAQGRLLHDIFIYPLHPQHALRERIAGGQGAGSAPAFLVEVDAEQIKGVQAFLKKYKLRAKVKIRAIEEGELGVWAAWTGGSERAQLAQTLRAQIANSSLLVAPDPRIPAPWSRVIAQDTDIGHVSNAASLSQVDESIYRLQRYLNGIPEGQHELPREETLLHEADVDLMQGVDFRKGCYVGQELVIRTQHTGVVRKRVMPIQIWTEDPPSETAATQTEPEYSGDVSSADSMPSISLDCPLNPLAGQNIKTKGAKRPEGKFLAGVGNVGLGLCRLERVIELEDGVAKGPTQIFEVDTEKADSPMPKTWIRPFIPKWWEERGQIMEGGYESLKARAPGQRG